jgi:hypothetical protein
LKLLPAIWELEALKKELGVVLPADAKGPGKPHALKLINTFMGFEVSQEVHSEGSEAVEKTSIILVAKWEDMLRVVPSRVRDTAATPICPIDSHSPLVCMDAYPMPGLAVAQMHRAAGNTSISLTWDPCCCLQQFPY